MSEELKKQLITGAAMLVIALMSSLGTMAGSCATGLATKGDITKATTEIKDDVKREVAKCVPREEMGDTPPAREKRPPVYDRLEALEAGQHELANEHALEARERTAFDVAFWRQLQTAQQRKVWQGARDGALYKWDAVALGKPPSKSADSVLREAGVPR